MKSLLAVMKRLFQKGVYQFKMIIPILSDDAIESILAEELVIHSDKAVISIPGYPRDFKNWNQDLAQIVSCMKAVLKAHVSDHAVDWGKQMDWSERRFRRFKRFRHENGLVDFFHERDFSIQLFVKNIAAIRSTSKNKLNYKPHHDIVSRMEQVLDYCSVPFHLGSIEVAIDTLNPWKGKAFRLYAFPLRCKARNRLRVIDDGFGPPLCIVGCNPDGNNQYYNFNNDYRQWHLYEKDCEAKTIFRTEIRFKREYLVNHDINTHQQLADKVELLVTNNIALKALNLDRLRSDYRQFKKEKTHPRFTNTTFREHQNQLACPPLGGIYELDQKLDMSRNEITRRYYDDLPLPDLYSLY